jgi:hypothetical protein
MPSGFEDYASLEFSAPGLALIRAQSHRTWLLQQIEARTSTEGTSFDPQPFLALVDIVDRDVARLAGRADYGSRPRFIPTRRVDPRGINRGA